MRSVALLPSIAILTGTYAGIAWPSYVPYAAVLLAGLWLAAAGAFARRAPLATIVAAMLAYALAGMMLGAAAARDALAPSIRTVLDATYGGFHLDTLGPPDFHPPTRVRARLVDDGARREYGVSLEARVESIAIGGRWQPVAGGVRLTVSGVTGFERAANWRAGRVIEAPVTFRRPARYLNHGVPDFERNLALGGTALNGGVKSGLLVRVIESGSAFEEAAAELRAYVRSAVERRVGSRDPAAGAIVTAILIGDRTALSDEVRDRLQAAGTYHVIAISGGNIAILAAAIAAVLLVSRAGGRASALAMIAGLAAYALVVSAGPSVWRATITALVYLAARLLDHRSSPWNAMAVSAAFVACAAPLDVRDVGFALTFGATVAIVEAARRIRVRETSAAARQGAPVSWIVTSVAASFATELVLLPVGASVFSRVTAAGLVLNLLAVPLMAVAQIAGLAAVAFDPVDWCGGPAGYVAATAARGLIESARLVDVLPWLAIRVPPPAPSLVVSYYATLAATLWIGRARRVALVAFIACAVALLTGVTSARSGVSPGSLRLTLFDVGQGESLLLQAPNGQTLMVDTGGTGFDGTAFDIGGRVLAPALWARGVRRLDTLAITHGDPDHIGGAQAIVRDFAVRQIWQGVPMPDHPPLRELLARGAASGASVHQRLAGWTSSADGLQIRVLHPPPPDWERLRVRNDDSLVLELRYGDVAFLLTGDAGADVERSLLPRLTPARHRILKVGHHGSRTSTSQALVDAWRPQVALISCGRGNRFGHPAPEVVRRLEAAGSRIYRTDRDGQITVDTDGRSISVRTYIGGLQ